MEYTAMYRKFRPQKFSEIVGQEHITTTIKNQIKSGRVGHAYLLNGVRGTGKTTTAKILARAINCLNPKDGEPCNECENCLGILNGTITDVLEMDAASNNSVEDIRSIREEINFLPTKAKYRVYIIDEVHMLSTGAFNALLKTLEEPPAHAKFILATTEPQKLPATILSRCQRFDFKKIDNQNIVKRLKIICEEMNLKVEEEALEIIAVLSEGAVRDALSILERCAQENENIDANLVKELVGIPKLTYIHKLVKAIIQKDVETSLQTIDEVLNEGMDLVNYTWEVIKYLKDILVYKSTKKLEIYNKEEIEEISSIAENSSKELLINLIYKFSELENSMKFSSQKTILFQTGIIKMCVTEENNSLEERLKKLEIKISNLNTVSVSTQKQEILEEKPKIQQNLNKVDVIEPQKEQIKKVEIKKQENKVEVKSNVNSGIDLSNKPAENYWPKVLSDLKQNGKVMLYANLINTVAKPINDMTVGIEFKSGLNSFRKELLEKPENKNELIRLVSIECGKTMNIKYVDACGQSEKNASAKVFKEIPANNENSSVVSSNLEELTKNFDIPINFIEE